MSGVVLRLIHYKINYNDFQVTRNNLDDLIRMSHDERLETRHHITRRINFASKIFKSYGINACTFVVVLTTIAIFMGKLPYVWPHSSVENSSLAVHVIASIHMVVAVSSFMTFFVIENLMPVILLSYVLGVLDELADKIKMIGKSEEIGHAELVKCVQVHENTKNYVGLIEELFGVVFFCQSLGSYIVIGFFIFNYSESVEFLDLLKSAVLVMLAIYEIFLPCFFGSQLNGASSNLTDEVYCSNWLNLDFKTKKILVTFMENLKNPMEITYHGLFDANLESFQEIVDSAYSLCAILQQLR